MLHLLRKRGIREKFQLTFFAPMPSPGERMGKKAVAAIQDMFRNLGQGQGQGGLGSIFGGGRKRRQSLPVKEALAILEEEEASRLVDQERVVREALERGEGLVTATPQGGTKTVTGKVAVIDNTVDAATGTIALKAEFANADEILWPGQLCNVRVTLRTDPDVVSIPRMATQSGQTGNFVYIIEGHVQYSVGKETYQAYGGDFLFQESGVVHEWDQKDGARFLASSVR